MSNTVLILGGGSREQALAWKVSQSPVVSSVLVAPGNAGSSFIGPKVQNIELSPSNVDDVCTFCVKNKIDLVIVGPEDPLHRGVVDKLTKVGVKCFGPTKDAAQIETDKEFSKNFMAKYSIPTAKYQVFKDSKAAQDFIKNATFNATVIKATGLTGGKGVLVCSSRDEAIEVVPKFLNGSMFGDAGKTIVIEEFLEGQEISLLVFTDGKNVELMPPMQDHKRCNDGDNGPNTGGMGAVGPLPFVDQELLESIKKEIILPTIRGLASEGCPFKGCLFAGLMLTTNGPKVLEFNARFGDPETQSVLPLLQSDLHEILIACIDGKLDSVKVKWSPNKFTCGIVIASENYPSKPILGRTIRGLENIPNDLLVFHGGTKNNGDTIVTSGGRIVTITAVGETLSQAMTKAKSGVKMVKIQGSFYRKDIGLKALMVKKSNTSNEEKQLTYKSSGVDIVAGERLVDRIKELVKGQNRRGTMDCIGGFGALFDLKAAGFTDPILVSGTDGVGTKLKIAIEFGKHDTIGIDLVAMCVNDIIVQGAEPLFFLDYYASSKLEVDVAASVIKGITDGCKLSNCSLIGGETAEMPGLYQVGDFDLAGFCVGAVDRDKLLPRQNEMKVGDVIIGLPSSGIHSNGYSLVRKLLEIKNYNLNDIAPFDTSEKTIAETLLVPTKIYVKSLLPVIRAGLLKGLAHITGGGLLENIPRVLPKHLCAHLNCDTWTIPAIVRWMQNTGNVTDDVMLRTFNCGLGMVLIVDAKDADATLSLLRATGEPEAAIVGSLKSTVGDQRVVVENFGHQSVTQVSRMSRKRRVAVLISGSGTNLQALIDHTKDESKSSQAEIVLVISNVPNVLGLERATRSGIKTLVIESKGKKRVEFDQEVTQALVAHDIEFVCLAGFMRIVSPQFVETWEGKLINIHPSLLPSFKGMHTHEEAIAAGVRIHGATIHFVDSGVDTGAIILQESIPILLNDTPETLQERVKVEIEHHLYPKALEMLVREQVKLDLKTKKCIWK